MLQVSLFPKYIQNSLVETHAIQVVTGCTPNTTWMMSYGIFLLQGLVHNITYWTLKFGLVLKKKDRSLDLGTIQQRGFANGIIKAQFERIVYMVHWCVKLLFRWLSPWFITIKRKILTKYYPNPSNYQKETSCNPSFHGAGIRRVASKKNYGHLIGSIKLDMHGTKIGTQIFILREIIFNQNGRTKFIKWRKEKHKIIDFGLSITKIEIFSFSYFDKHFARIILPLRF